MQSAGGCAEKHPQNVKNFDQNAKSLYKVNSGKSVSLYH
jgi:hypothetical protein